MAPNGEGDADAAARELERIKLQWRKCNSERTRLLVKMGPVQKQLRDLDYYIGPKWVTDRKDYHFVYPVPEDLSALNREEMIDRRRKLHKEELIPQLFLFHAADAGFRDAEKALVAYSKRECQQMSFQLLHRLPRELVDICYGYLLDKETVRIIGDQVRYHVNTVVPYSILRLKQPEGPVHLIDPSFVHPVMATEILTIIAKNPGDRKYLAPRRSCDVNRVLDMEPYGLGVRASAFWGDLYLEWYFAKTDREITLYKVTNPNILRYSPAVLAKVHKILLNISPCRGRCLYLWFRIGALQDDEVKQLHLPLEPLTRRGFKLIRFDIHDLWHPIPHTLPPVAIRQDGFKASGHWNFYQNYFHVRWEERRPTKWPKENPSNPRSYWWQN